MFGFVSRSQENDYPYPESNLFKHPALPLRYSHYNVSIMMVVVLGKEFG